VLVRCAQLECDLYLQLTSYEAVLRVFHAFHGRELLNVSESRLQLSAFLLLLLFASLPAASGVALCVTGCWSLLWCVCSEYRATECVSPPS
jgi:hypothetical protein